MHDGKLRRIAAGFGVLSDEALSCKEINVIVRNDGDHGSETIGVYLDIIPPGGPSNPFGCLPNGRLLETSITLRAGKSQPVHSVTGILAGTLERPVGELGFVAFSCSDQAGAFGKTYTIIAVVDVHGDDLASCGPGSLVTAICANALADDDNDTTNNRSVRNALRVKSP